MSFYLSMYCISLYYLFYILYYISYIIYKNKHRAVQLSVRCSTWLQSKYFPVWVIRLPFLSVLHPDPSDVDREDRSVINRTVLYRVSNKQTDYQQKRSIFFVHGGGFVSGDYQSYRSFCLELVRRTDDRCPIEIWFPEYRLCPENHVGDSISDILMLYQEIQRTGSTPLIIADSAGAFLAIQLLQSVSRCPGLLLLSPILNVSPCFFGNKSSIYSIDYSKIPPVTVWLSDTEIFSEDGVQFVNDVIKYGGNAKLYKYRDTVHLWMLFWFLHEEGEQAMGEILDTILKQSKKKD